MLGQAAVVGRPSALRTSAAGSETAWSRIGQVCCKPIVWFLYTLLPEICRANLFRVSERELLSSAQATFAAPRWSTSTVRKSSRLRSASPPRPPVLTEPMWIGWSVIWTDLKFEPVLRAFCD